MNLTNGKVFCLSMLIGTVSIVSYSWVTNLSRLPKSIHNVDNSGIFLTDQIRVSDFPQFKRLHMATIVDMRPDGETEDQPPSQDIAEASKRHGIVFEYIPIPHGDIPSSGVDQLSLILTNGKRPILLYCRTGNRALRTFCLAEASRIEGHSEEELVLIAKKSGFSINDLMPELERRIAARKSK